MPVDIKINGSFDTPEYKDALELKNIFESQIPRSINGQILIINNATLFGQEVKDIDIIVIGNFERQNNLKLNIKTKYTFEDDINKSSQYLDQEGYVILSENKNKSKIRVLKDKFEFDNVYINNFCFVIETKKHIPSDIIIEGITLKVKYNNKLSDVTTQSEKQKYSLKRYFEDRLGFSPYICNYIWLKNVEQSSLNELISNNDEIKTQHNYLPREFSLKWLFQLACMQNSPFKIGNFLAFSSHQRFNNELSEIQEVFNLFVNIKKFSGEITRKKLKMLTNSILDEDKLWVHSIGEKLVVLSGKAGTGKTIKILRIAFDLIEQKNARVLILTFNHALVGDIRRLLAIEGVPDGIDSHTIHISTLHKFFFELILGFGIEEGKFIPMFIIKYKDYLRELYEYINQGLINVDDIQQLMKKSHDQVAWDYVLIDEAQDWDEIEKQLIFLIFGKNKIIIGDGIDQLVRSQQKCNWVGGLNPGIDFIKKSEQKCLRQAKNLVYFVNLFAEKLNINWTLSPTKEFIGGKVIITTKSYNKMIHEEEYQKCKEKGNIAYDFMFLVPPNLVKRVQKTNQYNEKQELRSFLMFDEYKSMGINVWDGTNTELRCDYAIDPEQHRLIQYESCRGLEAWTIVCLDFDEFVKSKFETYKDTEQVDLGLVNTYEERRNEYVFLWALIPLTRAIDTIIITIKDTNSLLAKKLKEISFELNDFVTWID